MEAEKILKAVVQMHPLVHCISNIVTVNDCANVVLAVGGSPIMAQGPEEMGEITALADALVLNTGTPDTQKFEACREAGIAAGKKGIPVVLDPVGAGAGNWRRDRLLQLLEKVHPDIVRVNASEAAALLGREGSEHGVDTGSGETEAEALAAALAKKLGCVVLLSGSEDIVTDGSRLKKFGGGSSRMKRLTGAGCMLSCLCATFAAAEHDHFAAVCAAAEFWKDCAARAAQKAAGMGSFHAALLDEAGRTTDEILSQIV